MRTLLATLVVLLSGMALAQAKGTPPAAAPQAPASAAQGNLSASEVLRQVLDSDPWGLGGGEVNARAIVREPKGQTRELVFYARSNRYEPPLTHSLVRFSAPADIAGMGFLQVQKKERDDDRFLYLPDMKRSRRIAASLRKDSFMGTDFSYADLDRRDLRDSDPTLEGIVTFGKYPCYHLKTKPRNSDALYGSMELWVRQDNMLPLKWALYDKNGKLVKTLLTKEVQRLQGRWYSTRSLMTDNVTNRTTELLLDKVVPRDDIAADEFTVANLEKS